MYRTPARAPLESAQPTQRRKLIGRGCVSAHCPPACAQTDAVPPQRAAQSDRIYSSQEYSREVSELVASIETTLTSSKRRAETAATDTESAEADAQQRTYGQGRLRGGQQMAPGELKTPDVSTILNKIETLNNLSKPPATDEPTHAPQTNTQLPTPPPTSTACSSDRGPYAQPALRAD